MPDHFIMTTWHEDFNEGVWHAFDVSFHDEVDINTIVVLDLTGGQGIERVKELLIT